MYPAPESTSFVRQGARLTVRGELDRANRHALWAALVDLLSTPSRSVSVALDGVTFVDAAGLTALLRAQRTAAERGVRLVLETPSLAVLRILDRTRATDLFDIAY
jgi:anti-sigma B factor antagonist